MFTGSHICIHCQLKTAAMELLHLERFIVRLPPLFYCSEVLAESASAGVALSWKQKILS